jgi:hypothetical protein
MSSAAESIGREDGEALIKRVLLDITGTALDDLATAPESPCTAMKLPGRLDP